MKCPKCDKPMIWQPSSYQFWCRWCQAYHKPVAAAALALVLAGCNALGGIPPETVDAIASAGGGCVRVTGIYGTGVIMIASTDRGVIRNGSVTVADNCAGITIQEAPRPK